MRNVNKLVALLLAAVMVLGMLPGVTVHAHEHDHNAVATQGIEEYPAMALDTEYTVNITEGGTIAYFTFTPTAKDLYTLYSFGPGADTRGYLYDSEMNQLADNDEGNGEYRSNFAITYELEADTTYVLGARYYFDTVTGSFPVYVTTAHSYTSEVTKEATCTEDGVLTYTCSYCGGVKEEVIPASHTYGEDGNCTICGAAYLITGTCGENLTWELDFYGNLTISGTGAMYDYAQYATETETAAPWNSLTYEQNPKNVSVKTAVIADGVTTIGNNAFNGCYYLETVSLPETLTSIGNYAFANCSVKEVVIPDSVTSIGTCAFQWCGSLTSVTLPTGLTEIPEKVFQGCGSLTSVVWPENLTTIGNSAFYYGGFLELVIPEGVTTIGESAFSSNGYMTSVTIPSTVTSVGGYAFASNWNLKAIVFQGDVPTFGEYVFNRATADAYYPAGNTTWTTDVLQNYGGTLTWHALCAEHTFGDWETFEATCTVEGYKTRSCSVCGWTETEVLAEALGHDYQVTNVKEPVCGDYYGGYTEYTCTRCGDQTYDYTYLWHEYQPTETIEASCTTQGYTVYTCTNCGATYNDNYTDALPHTLGEWSEPTEATCTEDGVKTAVCSVCSTEVSEVVTPALGHEWSEEGTENENGSITYPCTRCDATYTTEGTTLMLGDNVFSVARSTGSASKTYTATETGTLTITTSDLNYHNAYAYDNGYTDQYWQPIAIDWGFQYGQFGVKINDAAVAYTVEGYETAAKIISTVEVTAGDVITVTLFNDQDKSYYYGNDIQVNMNLAMESSAPETVDLVLGDNVLDLPVDATVNGTWTADAAGTLTVKLTSILYQDPFMLEWFGEEWTEMPVENALASNYYTLTVNGEGVTSIDGTTIDVAAGDVVSVAVGNGYGYNSKVTVNLAYAEPHTHSYTAVVTEPTCTEYGYTTYVCECGDSYVDDDSWTEPEHKWDDGVVTAPTCTEKGYTTFTCTACGESYVDEDSYTDALGHSYESVVTEPTCTEGGYTTHTCAVCGDSYTDAVTEATGHSWKGLGCENCDATRENPFVDVPEDSFYIDPVLWAVEKGITTGVDETHFDPNGKCLRAAVVTFLWRAAGSPEPTSTENPFEDVKESDFYYKAVLWAVETGVTNGTSATTFSPMDVCNRAQVVTFLHRAMGSPAPESTEHPFTDVVEGMFYMDAMLWAVETGVTNGLTKTTFGPLETCNRAQVVTFLYRAYN